MRLLLSMLAWPDGAKPLTREIDGELVIGRGRDSDWMLPDPNNLLSRRHCVLTPFGECWRVADLSLNGTYINDATAPLGRDGTHELHDGDQIRIGGYVIETRILPQAALGGPPAAGTQAPWPPDVWPPQPGGGLWPDGSRRGAPGESDGPAIPDHVPAMSSAWQPPPPASVVLPDDWDQEPPPPAPAPSVARTELPADWDQPPAPEQPPRPALPAAGPPPPAPPLSVTAPPVPIPPDPVPAVVMPPSLPDPGADGALLAAFLRGVGLRDIGGADPAAMMERVGALLRVMIDQLRAVQIARAAVKREFRILATMARPEDNNPIKFSADTDAALQALLTGRQAPGRAAGEVLDEIRLHELAMIAAMRDAVHELLETLSPARIRATAGEHGLLPVQRKAHAFEHYEALHGRTVQALADNFDSVFGKAFARAYERVALNDADQRVALGESGHRGEARP